MNEFVAICLLIVLPFILAIVINEAGRRTLQRDYDAEYAHLEYLVNHAPTYMEYLKYLVNHAPTYMEYYDDIRNRFIKIKKYKCRDKEKLDVLERKFHRRFSGQPDSDKSN